MILQRQFILMFCIGGYSFVLPAQTLSWAVPVENLVNYGSTGMIERPDGTVAMPSWVGYGESKLATFDWLGHQTDTMQWPSVSHIRPLEDGYIISGMFSGSMELGGETFVGGIGLGDFYVARYDAMDNLQWVTHSMSIWPNGGGLIDMAVSQAGNVTLLLRGGPRFTLNGDTIACNWANDWLLVTLNPAGSLEWYQPLNSTTISTPLSYEYAEIAFDNADRLWLAATMNRSFTVDEDTIQVIDQDLYDHVIIQFDPQGDMTNYTVVSGGSPSTHSITGMGMLPHPNGGVVWYGRCMNGASVNGVTIDSAGMGYNGLIMHLDGPVELQWQATFGLNGNEQVSAACWDAGTGKLNFAGTGGRGSVIGPDTLPNDPVTYCFLATMDPDGTIEESQFFCGTATTQYWMVEPHYILCNTGVCHVIGYTTALALFTNGTWIGESNFLARFDPAGTQSIPTVGADYYDIRVFPCPTAGPVELRIDQALTGLCVVAVRNSLGALVHHERSISSSGALHMDLSHLPSGLYTIQLTASGRTFTQKVVIEGR